MRDRDNSNGIIWFAAGAILGASVALLYAPKTGKDSREYITGKADESLGSIGESGKQIMEQGKDLYERGRALADEAAELSEKGRKMVQG
jgi:gas vesicle protein